MRLNENGDGYFVINKDQLMENENRNKRISQIFINQSIYNYI